MESRKFLTLGLILILVLSLFLIAGCGKQRDRQQKQVDDPTPKSEVEEEPETEEEPGKETKTVSDADTCSDLKGDVCDSTEDCKGTWLDASDTFSCCSKMCESVGGEDTLDIELFESTEEDEIGDLT